MFKVKSKKNIIAIVSIGIIIALVILIIIIKLLTGFLSENEILLGANTNSFFYVYEIFPESYQTLEEGLKERDEKWESEQQICQIENNGIVHIFMQGEEITENKKGEIIYKSSYIRCYDFIEKGNVYYYRGERKLNAGFRDNINDYTWKETFLADLFVSRSSIFEKIFMKQDKALMAWGVSDNSKIESVTVDGQKIDEVHTIDVDGKEYYLWIIYDLQTENKSADVVIEEN